MSDQLICKIRKQLPNYSLPSEAWESLKGLIGKRIRSIKTGIQSPSPEAATRELGLNDPSAIWTATHGGPIFIICDETTYIIQSDDLTFSLAIRIARLDAESPTFIEQLYTEDDYFPTFQRVQSLVDLGQSCMAFIGQQIQAIKILKLPDNYFFSPANGLNVSEVAIVFSFDNSEDLLVAFRMGGVPGNGHCLLTWNLVSTTFPKEHLICIRESPESEDAYVKMIIATKP